MAAPQHRVLLLPLSLLHSDKRDRELQGMLKDYSNTPYGKATQPFGDLDQLPRGFIDISEDVYAIRTNKTLTLSTAGTFVLSMVDRRRFGMAWGTSATKVPYTVNIQPNDLIVIMLNRGEQRDRFKPVMIGVVERLYAQTKVSGNRVSHSVNVTGYDLTHWLHEHRNFFWLYAIGPGGRPSTALKELQRRLGSNATFLQHYLPATEELPADKVLDRVFKPRGRTLQDGFISAQFPRLEMFTYNPMPTQSRRARDAQLTDNNTRGSLFGFGERYVPDSTSDAFYGGVANILSALSFQPFCELWCDVDSSGRFNLNHRRCPFDQEDWDALTTHVVDDNELTAVDLGRALHDLVNFVSVLPRVLGASETDLVRLFLPHTFRLDWSRIKDVGLRPMIITTRYLDGFGGTGDITLVKQQGNYNSLFDPSSTIQTASVGNRQRLTIQQQVVTQFINGKGRLAALAGTWAQTLWDWHVAHPRYWAGRVTIKGDPGIRVGERVELPSSTHKHFDQPMVLYVSGVSHNYDVDQGMYLTTLMVERGQPKVSFVRPVTSGSADIPDAEREKLKGTLEVALSLPSIEIEVFLLP